MSELKNKLSKPFLRRLLIGLVIFPPMVAITNSEREERVTMKAVGQQIVIPGSKSYLDPNPSF